MPHKLADHSTRESSVLHAAAQELLNAADALSVWREAAADAGTDELAVLQRLLVRIDALDAGTAGARRNIASSPPASAANRGALATYESALQKTLREFQELEGVLQDQKNRLSPRVDAGARESEARSAYARALSRS